MDEQQIMQILDQIPLDVLQEYVMQRAQQEQAMQQQQMGEQAYMQGAADEAAAAQMAYGGDMPVGFNPYLDAYGVPIGTTNPFRRAREYKRGRKR